MTEIEIKINQSRRNLAISPQNLYSISSFFLLLCAILMMIVFKPFRLCNRVNRNVTHSKVSLMSEVNERIMGRWQYSHSRTYSYFNLYSTERYMRTNKNENTFRFFCALFERDRISPSTIKYPVFFCFGIFIKDKDFWEMNHRDFFVVIIKQFSIFYEMLINDAFILIRYHQYGRKWRI